MTVARGESHYRRSMARSTARRSLILTARCLRGASGPVIGEALKAAGVTDRSIPGEQLIYRMYDLFGENRPSMEVTKRAVRFASGWVRSQVQEAGVQAAEALATSLQPFARPILDEHRKAGRPLVLATTTPYDLVKPLADALGFDDVVATRYGEHDGVYDGTLDGEFVWGEGKLRAIAEWAMENAVSLSDSWAYSDSFYDVPMLSAVRHPVVVNPDPRMLVVALFRRWPVVHLDVPAGVPKLPVVGIEPQKALMPLARPELIPYARFDIAGVEHIPEDGPGIIVGNHRSYFDPLAMARDVGQARAARALPRQEGGVRRADRRPDRQGDGRHPRRAGHRLRRAAGRGGAGARGRRAGGDDARGHHPARAGLLRSRAQGPLGRRAPRRHDGRSGHPRRPVGHREGVAPQRAHCPTCSPCGIRRRSRSASARRWRASRASHPTTTPRRS